MTKLLLVAFFIGESLVTTQAAAQTNSGILRLATAPQNQATQQKQSATIHGRVVDARTGEPMAKVKVIATGTDHSATTDENGLFVLENLTAGPVDLYITTVSYGLVKKTVTLNAGDNTDFQIALNESAAALTERVTVNADPFENTETNLSSGQTLNKRELQDLASAERYSSVSRSAYR